MATIGSAIRCQPRSLWKSATMSRSSIATKCQTTIARRCLGTSATKCPYKCQCKCLTRSAIKCPGKSAQKSPSRCHKRSVSKPPEKSVIKWESIFLFITSLNKLGKGTTSYYVYFISIEEKQKMSENCMRAQTKVFDHDSQKSKLLLLRI